MGGQSGLSELSVILWVSAFEGCPLSGVNVPLYSQNPQKHMFVLCKIRFPACCRQTSLVVLQYVHAHLYVFSVCMVQVREAVM